MNDHVVSDNHPRWRPQVVQRSDALCGSRPGPIVAIAPAQPGHLSGSSTLKPCTGSEGEPSSRGNNSICDVVFTAAPRRVSFSQRCEDDLAFRAPASSEASVRALRAASTSRAPLHRRACFPALISLIRSRSIVLPKGVSIWWNGDGGREGSRIPRSVVRATACSVAHPPPKNYGELAAFAGLAVSLSDRR
jgi:hypothetical protein